jgi:hypothetical protein
MRLHVDPTDSAKVSVMRLEYSPDMSSCLADGSSPFLNDDTVGKASSSATQGSSILSVAGKKRAPARQCACAVPPDKASEAAQAKARRKCKLNMFFSHTMKD